MTSAPDAGALADLPVEDGFRLRGLGMTRLETFTDAAFAFAVTLTVVSVDSVPGTYDELLTAMRGLPIFAASFGLLMIFWHGHWRWSRRFGLEDGTSILLSVALVFTVLSYVYPLKFTWALLTHWLTDGALASGAALESPRQLDVIFAIYGTAFVAMSLVLVGLHLHALRLRETLALSPLEVMDTWGDIVSWSIFAGVGVLSVAIALSGVGPAASGGWAYMLLPVLMPAWGIHHSRRRARLIEGAAGPTTPTSPTPDP